MNSVPMGITHVGGILHVIWPQHSSLLIRLVATFKLKPRTESGFHLSDSLVALAEREDKTFF